MMEDFSQNLEIDDEPITRLFKAACTSGKIHLLLRFPCLADHKQNYQPYLYDIISAKSDDCRYTHTHTYTRGYFSALESFIYTSRDFCWRIVWVAHNSSITWNVIAVPDVYMFLCLMIPSAEDNGSSAQPENVHLTSAEQWRTFSDSLASEGFVTELSEQQQLQKIWDRALISSDAFGKRYCFTLEKTL